MNSTAGMILIGIGVLFDVLGCLGLVRLPDVYNRLQAATKCVTLGTCLILVGVAVAGWGNGGLVIKSLLCAVFILLTSPVGAHALARGAYHSGVKLHSSSVVDEYRDSPALANHRARPNPTPAQEHDHAQAKTP